MKTHHKPFPTPAWCIAAILLFAVIVTLRLWLPFGSTGGHIDIQFHMNRYASMELAQLDGQPLPELNPAAANGLGLAVNILYAPLTAVLANLFHLFIGNWALVANLLMTITVAASGIIMYYFTRELFNGKHLPALIAGLFYALSPYLTHQFLFLQDQACAFSFPFLALLIWGLWRLVNSRPAIVMLAIATAGLFLSHTISFFIAGCFSIVFLALNFRKLKPKILALGLAAVSLAMGLAAFFAVPFARAATLGIYRLFSTDAPMTPPRTADNMNLDHFFSWIHGVGGTTVMSLRTCILIAVIILVFVGFWFLRRKLLKRYLADLPPATRTFAWQAAVIICLSFILATPLIDWHWWPQIFYNLQFSWRWIYIMSPFLAILVAMAVELTSTFSRSRAWAITTIVAVLLGLGLCIFPFSESSSRRITCEAGCGNITQSEYRTINFPPDIKTYPQIIQGNSRLVSYESWGSSHTVTISASEAETVVELPVIYYDGYQSDFPLSPGPHGLLAVSLPGDATRAEIRYGVNPYTLAGVIISSVTVATMTVVLITLRRPKRQQTR
jgi:hypothetical protein